MHINPTFYANPLFCLIMGIVKKIINLGVIALFPMSLYLMYKYPDWIIWAILGWLTFLIIWLLGTRHKFDATREWIPIVSSLCVIFSMLLTFYGFYVANDVWNITSHKEILVAGKMNNCEKPEFYVEKVPQIELIDSLIKQPIEFRYRNGKNMFSFLVECKRSIFHEYVKLPADVDTLWIVNPDKSKVVTIPWFLTDINGNFSKNISIGAVNSTNSDSLILQEKNRIQAIRNLKRKAEE